MLRCLRIIITSLKTNFSMWVPFLSGWLSGKESACPYRKLGFDPVWEDPWRRKWQPTPVFLPRKFHEQSLEDCGPWGRKRVRHKLVAEEQPFSMPYLRCNGTVWSLCSQVMLTNSLVRRTQRWRGVVCCVGQTLRYAGGSHGSASDWHSVFLALACLV